MIPARLQFGPFDGQTGEVIDRPIPLALDVTRCRGCGCGRPIHYRITQPERLPERGYHRYEMVDYDQGRVLYRHADTLDPIDEAVIFEVLAS